MKIITIIHENRTGLIAELTELLETAGINIDRIHALSDDKRAEIRITTSDYTKTLSMLNAAGYKAIPMENILVRVEDRPGALARLSRRLSDEAIDIRGITMVQQFDGYTLVTITTDNDIRAREVLADILVA
jgi:hypothetical protein